MERSRARPLRVAVALALGAIALGILWFLFSRGIPFIASRENYFGYLAAVWAPNGRYVFVLSRETSGTVSGFGWESFTPPARVSVNSDRLQLLRVNAETGETEILHEFDGSPLVGRSTGHYRGRIFNYVSAKLEADENAVRYVAQMSIPRVPSSESWQLAGEWSEQGVTDSEWRENGARSTATPDSVLLNGVEVLMVPGEESFPAAVLLVEADGTYRVLLKSAAFDRLYPAGVPAGLIAERSHRSGIERSRELTQVQTELVSRFIAEGMSEGEAMLRAHDEMVDLGYFARPPQIVATAVSAEPDGLRVFEIPGSYFVSGLFQDIAAAIESPGQEVAASTGTYLKYYDDELGPELREWIESGNESFVVRSEGALYVLEIRRYDDAGQKTR